MAIFRSFITTVLILQLAGVQALAQLLPLQESPLNTKEKMRAESFAKSYGSLGFDVKVDKRSGTAWLVKKGTNEKLMEIPLAEERPLRNFSPKNLNTQLLNEFRKIKSATTPALSHSLKNLPLESLVFFVSMGAVAAGQLLTNYSQNPLALEQHLHHSASPIGVASFYAFMATQGVTSNVLSLYSKNPHATWIPYMGMAMGGFVSQYLSGIAMDPNVKACANSWFGKKPSASAQEMGVDAEPCEKAYEHLVLHKKMWEMAPSLISMVTSGLLAAGLQSGLAKGFRFVGLFDIALLLTPGGVGIRGAKAMIAKGTQLAGFGAIDVLIFSYISSAWANLVTSHEIEQIDFANLRSARNVQELEPAIDSFSKKMNAWRMTNLSKVYEAHNNWATYLSRLTGNYGATYSFYSTLINEIQADKWINRSYPLNGITPKDMASGKDDIYLANPAMVQAWQLETLADVAQDIKNKLSSGYYQQKGFMKSEIAFIQTLSDSLQTQDLMKMGLALAELNKKRMTVHNMPASSGEFYYELYRINSALGSPDPIFDIGRGFIENLSKSSLMNSFRDVEFPGRSGAFMTSKVTDYLLIQMICGPDVLLGEKTISTTAGFKAEFRPPQIKVAEDELDSACYANHLNAQQIFSMNLLVNGQKYRGVIDYVRKNIRDDILVGGENKFGDWWTSHVEPEMHDAFKDYGKKYEAIVADLVANLKLEKNKKINFSNLSNAVTVSALQEIRTYLMLLDGQQNQLDLLQLRNSATLRNPLLQEIQVETESILALLSKIEATERKGHKVVQSKLENLELDEKSSAIQALLVQAQEELGPSSSKLLEKIQAAASELLMYGSIANAVSWDKIQNSENLSLIQQAEKERRRNAPGLTGAGR